MLELLRASARQIRVTAPLRADCTFRARLRLPGRRAGRLTLTARFGGDDRLLATDRRTTVRAG